MGYIEQSESLLLLAAALKDVRWLNKHSFKATCPVCGQNVRYKRAPARMDVCQVNKMIKTSAVVARCNNCKADTRRIAEAVGLQERIKYETAEGGKASMPNSGKPFDGNIGETLCTTCAHYDKAMGFAGCKLRNEYRKGDSYAGPDACEDYRVDSGHVEAGREAILQTIQQMEQNLIILRGRLQLLDRVTGRVPSKTVSADGFEQGGAHD